MAGSRTAPVVVLPMGGRRARHEPVTAAQPRGGLLYQQVIDRLELLIVEQSLAPGDALPTQREIAELTGTSLITVRRALEELERAGRVRRHQGLGTFLARPRIVSDPARSGGLRATLGGQWEVTRVGSRVLDVEVGDPSPDLRAALRLHAKEQVWRVRRLRHVQGSPAVLETAVIPVGLTPDLDHYSNEMTGSLYEVLSSKYSLEDDNEEQYLEVAVADAEQRRHLKLPPRATVVVVRGLSFTPDGTPFDCFTQVYPAADFVFAISGATSRELLRDPGFGSLTVTVPPSAPLGRSLATTARTHSTRRARVTPGPGES